MYIHVYVAHIFSFTLHQCTYACVDLTRRHLDMDERRYLMGRGVVTEIQSNLGKYEESGGREGGSGRGEKEGWGGGGGRERETKVCAHEIHVRLP